MTTPSISLPPLECPDVLLPTPANLANLFKGLASHAYTYEVKELKDTLDKLRKDVLDIYDPKFDKIEIPEIEWEIMMTRLAAEYPMYVQQKILSFINDILTINFKVTILGIEIDILEFLANPSTVLDNIKIEEVDSIYDLIPEEYKVWDKFETADFKKESIRNFIRSEVAKKMNLLLHGGFTDLIGEFQEIWDALGLPTIPVLEQIDLVALIKDKSMEELEKIELFGFKLTDLLGGDFNDKVEIPEFQKERLLKKAREFVEEWQTYLIKKWMEIVTEFFEAIGLDKLTGLLTFTFCDFLTLVGFPKTIDLPDSVQTIINTTQSPLPNTTA